MMADDEGEPRAGLDGFIGFHLSGLSDPNHARDRDSLFHLGHFLDFSHSFSFPHRSHSGLSSTTRLLPPRQVSSPRMKCY